MKGENSTAIHNSATYWSSPGTVSLIHEGVDEGKWTVYVRLPSSTTWGPVLTVISNSSWALG